MLFTHFNETLTEISKMLKDKGCTVFQVSRQMDPTSYNMLRKFKNETGKGGCRLRYDSATAAVGLTLTAASRLPPRVVDQPRARDAGRRPHPPLRPRQGGSHQAILRQEHSR